MDVSAGTPLGTYPITVEFLGNFKPVRVMVRLRVVETDEDQRLRR